MATGPERPPNDSGPPSGAAVDEFLGTGPARAWRRWMQWIAVIVAAVVLTVLIGRFVSGGQATDYASETVERGDLHVVISGGGRLQPVAVRAVAARLAGTIAEVLVRENDRVVDGEILARIDPAPFQEAADRARQQVDARQADLDRAQAAQRDAANQLSLYERVRQHSGGTVPGDREMAMARSAAAHAADAASTAQIDLIAARAALARTEADLAATAIRAPAAGVVLRRNVSPGQSVGRAPGQSLFTIAAPYARLRVDAVMSGPNTGKLGDRAGAPASVVTPSGRAYPAMIVRVVPAASDTSMAVSLDVANPWSALRPGMAVMVRVDLGMLVDVMLIPDAALRFARASDAAQPSPGSAGDAVYVLETDGTPRRVPVTIGGSDGRRSEVTSDLLRPGMRVVTGLH